MARKFAFWKFHIFAAFFFSSFSYAVDLANFSCPGSPAIGVFYYPGWHEGARGLTYPSPWKPIKNFPEREPMLGWYDDADPKIISQQARWMRDYGLDYVVFDWYWGKDGVFLDQVIKQYKDISSTDAPAFAIMWANHTEESGSINSFESMVDFWIENYLKKDNYLKLEQRPVVYIFSLENLQAQSLKLGLTVRELLGVAQKRMNGAGLPNIHFSVGVTKGPDQISAGEAADADSFFAYNYQYRPDIPRKRLASQRKYSDLDEVYRAQWRQLSEISKIPFFVSSTTGWDKRPWGGSGDPNQDYSVSSPETFAVHLAAAGKASRSDQKDRLNSILICCWNEYGEGSVLEPTKKMGFRYLEVIKNFKLGAKR